MIGVAARHRAYRTARHFIEYFLSETASTELWWDRRLSLDRAAARTSRGEESRRHAEKSKSAGIGPVV
jgi:hypothetical protein